MLTVFLSGGMSGLTEEEKTGWRDLFMHYMGCNEEFKVVSPTDFKGIDNYETDEREAFVFDLYWVKKCDVVIANLNDMKSVGTAQEIMYAYTLKKPIIMICNTGDWDKIHPWYEEEATTIFYWDDNPVDTVLDIKKYLINYYV